MSEANLQLVLAQTNVYVKADAVSWQKLGSTTAQANLLSNKWLQTTTADQNFGDLGNLLDITKLPKQLAPQGTLSKGKTTTFDG